MGIRVGEGLLDGVDAEERGIWIGLGILEEMDVDELLDVCAGRGYVLENGGEEEWFEGCWWTVGELIRSFSVGT